MLPFQASEHTRPTAVSLNDHHASEPEHPFLKSSSVGDRAKFRSDVFSDQHFRSRHKLVDISQFTFAANIFFFRGKKVKMRTGFGHVYSLCASWDSPTRKIRADDQAFSCASAARRRVARYRFHLLFLLIHDTRKQRLQIMLPDVCI